jgi:hypothetical protein
MVRTLLEVRFYAPVQTSVRAHSLLYNGNGPLSRGQWPGHAIDYLPHWMSKKEKLELCLLQHVRGSPPLLSQVFSCPRTETNTEVEVILCKDPLLADYRTFTTYIRTKHLHYTPTNHDNVNCMTSDKNYITTVYPSLQDTIPHAVNLSRTFLKIGKKLPKTCSADLGDQ